jgi:hypothetical protein
LTACIEAIDGLKCALGCLIPYELYDSKLERRSFIFIDNRDTIRLIAGLLETHDCYMPESWREQLEKIAGEFALSKAPLEGVQLS